MVFLVSGIGFTGVSRVIRSAASVPRPQKLTFIFQEISKMSQKEVPLRKNYFQMLNFSCIYFTHFSSAECLSYCLYLKL